MTKKYRRVRLQNSRETERGLRIKQKETIAKAQRKYNCMWKNRFRVIFLLNFSLRKGSEMKNNEEDGQEEI